MKPIVPLVSIIIPVHNSETFLVETIESALNQTWPNKEIIIIDDGSSDKSLLIANSFQGIRVITQTNRGASAARNIGLAEAKGQFIQFLDADDMISADKIESQMNELLKDENEFKVAMCSWGRFNTIIQDCNCIQEPVWNNMRGDEWLIKSWDGGGMMPIHAWLIPIKIIEKAGLWNENLSTNDDGEFMTRVLLNSNGTIFCKNAIAYYRSNVKNSLSNQRNSFSANSEFRACYLSCNYLLNFNNDFQARLACANSYERLLRKLYPSEKDICKAIERCLKSLPTPSLHQSESILVAFLTKLITWKVVKRLKMILNKL